MKTTSVLIISFIFFYTHTITAQTILTDAKTVSATLKINDFQQFTAYLKTIDLAMIVREQKASLEKNYNEMIENLERNHHQFPKNKVATMPHSEVMLAILPTVPKQLKVVEQH